MKYCVCCFIFALICHGQVQAQAKVQASGASQLTSASIKGNISAWLMNSLDFADSAQTVLSNKLVMVSGEIDSFLGSSRANDEINGSQIRLRQINTFFEDGTVAFTFGTIFKLDLPKTNKRLSLVVESDEDSRETNESAVAPISQPIDGQEDNNAAVNSAIQLVIQDSKEWHIRAKAGVRFSEQRPNPNTKLRIRRLFSFEPWEFRITETLFWYLAEGWGETTRFDLERPMVPTFFFRATNQSTWFYKTNKLDYSQKFTIFHTIGETRLLYLQVGAYGQSQPDFHIGTYVASVHYRQLVYDDWLFADFTPMAIFPKTNNFEFSPAVVFALEMVIGATKKSAH